MIRALGLTALLLACESTAPGLVELDLSWADPPDAPISLSARVEDRSGPLPRTLVESEPAEFRRGGEPIVLELPQVPNGDLRVVVVEGREAADPEGPVLYGGVSAPFSIKAGKTTRVDVAIEFRAVEVPDADVTVDLRLGDIINPSHAPRAELEQATLITRSRGMREMRISNEPSFVVDSAEQVKLQGDPRCADEDGFTVCAIEWDFTADIESVDQSLHQVFIRFIDTAGFGLPLRRPEVIRDDRPPALVTGVLRWSDRPTFLPPDDELVVPAGAQVTATFVPTEPLAGPPEIEVDGRRTIGPDAADDGVYTITIPEPREGTWPVVVHLTDRARNTAAITLDDMTWDFTAPDELDINAFRLVRLPWGAEETDGAPRTRVEALEAGAIEAGATFELVRAEDDLCDADALLAVGDLGRLAEGVLGDVPRACLRHFDRAGNASRHRYLRNGEWVATLGGEVPGDDLVNPHQLAGTPWLDRWRLSDRGTGLGPEVARLGDGRVAETRGTWVWWRLGAGAAPEVTGHLVIDPHRGRLMVVDATEDGLMNPWTFRVAERSWQAAPASPDAPSARTGAVVVYDPQRDRLLLFGGLDRESLEDVWSWSPTDANWRRLASSACGFNGAGVFDELRDQVVLFGGVCTESTLGTRIWDPVTHRLEWWRGEGPSARADAALAWDPVDNLALMYGGRPGFAVEEQPLTDLWAWDGEAWAQWENDPAVGPGRRVGHSMIWDRARRQLVLHGGAAPAAGQCPSVWERGAGAEGIWTERRPEAPCPVADGSLVWVPALGPGGQVVLRNVEGVWAWEAVAGRWQRLAPVFTERPAGGTQTLAFDGDAQRFYLARRSGAGPPPTLHAREVGEGVWQVLDDVLPSTDGLGWSPDHGLVQEGAPGTWRRDRDGQWDLLGLAGAPPPEREALFITRGQRDVIRVGTVNRRLGLWRLGLGWSVLDQQAAGPFGARGAAGAWLPQLDQLLFFGGSSDNEPGLDPTTWTWTPGQGWAAPPVGAQRPPARSHAGLTYAGGRRSAVLFGGQDVESDEGGIATAHFDDLWEWNGEAWSEPPRSSPWPAARRGAALGYDAERRRLFLFGGSGPGQALSDAWEAGFPNGRPAQRLDIRLGAAGLPGDALLEVLTVQAYAGGTSGSGEPGVSIQGWRRDGWLEAATNDAPPDAPAPVEVVVDQRRRLRQGPVGAQKTMSFTLRPRGINGSGVARVVTDYVEARLRYRLPPRQ